MSVALAPAACFHCGSPVLGRRRFEAEIDGVPQPMCCPGCAEVARGIVAAGFADYYGSRTEYAAPSGPAGVAPPELALYDTGDVSEGVFSVDGIRCAACAWLIERRVARVPGVRHVDLNLATGRLQVAWDRALCKPSAILLALREVGYSAYPFDPARHGEQLTRERKTLFRQLFIAGLSMTQVMMYALPVYLAGDGTMDADLTALMQWASMLLTLPAVCYSAQPFFRGAWAGLRQRALGMDVPVALGIAAAFGGSVVALLRGEGEVYFDSITMFIFLLLGSRYFELDARRKAARALETLQRALPASALRIAGWPVQRATELVAAGRLRAGDVILVRPGEALAADGVLLEGHAELDLALLTGESRAQHRAPGATLPGGAVNAGQAIVVRAARAAGDSTLSMLVKLAERAGQGKPHIALWADRVAAWFVAALLVLAAAVLVAWLQVDPARAWQAAVAVLVVSCPCALSLATPAALAAATDRLLRCGVLVVRPHVLEALERATHVIFDKTGTLTAGRPVLSATQTLGRAPEERCRQLAAALEQDSLHPLAAALRGGPSAIVAHSIRQVNGRGVEGMVGTTRYRLGSAAYVGELAGPVLAGLLDSGAISVYLGSEAGWLARFALADPVRGEARELVRAFQARGKTVILLSGDQQCVADQVADELGIGTALGAQLPQQKLALVQRLQAGGAVVAMVGDGINDAAVLGAADVSFAMGGGSALAQMHADCVLLSGSLAALGEASATAARTMAVIRQNLAWATLYNLAAIPAAAMGLLNPWMAGVGMAASSAVVLANALRLRRKVH